jgi:E3 ubiquitin-protein ligase RNF146
LCAGWWEYDERTSRELEAAFRDRKREIELLVAGFIYVIDLVNMTQVRTSF